ncbi:TonB-dependent receptor [Niveibacterium terrae]|uniref:TonB-dependent receptor n=1 Tax=Niveibacterium terrae TaxID=3373598 RepID=UPI003A8D027D
MDAETASPVQVISHADIERSGAATISEVLQKISANSGGSYSENFSNSFSPGAAGIALRGLGQKSTLVLINGRRAPNYGFAQNLSDTYFDINSIPAAAVERVEVLKDGSSAIYGSDAVAGVINVILRHDYQGAEVAADYGTSNKSDLTEKHVALTGGFGNLTEDGFNVLTSIDYFKRDGITYADRSKSSNYGGVENWSTNAGTYRTSPRAAFANCPTGASTMDASNWGLSGTVCGYNPASYVSLIPSTERINSFTSGEYRFSDKLQAFGNLFLSHTKTNQSMTPSSLTSTSVRYDPSTGGIASVSNKLPVGNSSNPYSTAVGIGYTFFDVGARTAEITTDMYRVMGGLKGNLTGSWDWESAVWYGESKTTQDQYNRVNAVALADAIANDSYNFLSPTTAQTDALRINTSREGKSKLYAGDFHVTGDVYALPAGSISLATGLEVRRETMDDVPDSWSSGGYILGQGATETHGARNVSAGYFEVTLPVHKKLELSLAGREDYYSDFGSAFSPKAGFKFTPSKMLAIRGTVSRGFRAPTLAENAQSNSTYFTSVTDKSASSPNYGKTVSIAGVLQSNPNLQPEKSTSYNFGFVVQPAQAIDFTVDYYHIKKTNEISTDSEQYVVNHESDAAYAGKVVRNSEGDIVYVVTSYRNLQYIKTSGVDLTFNWRLGQVGPAKASLKVDWNYLISWKSPQEDGTDVEYAGNDGSSNGAMSKNKGSATLNFDAPVWSAGVTGNFYGGYDLVADDGVDQARVDHWLTTDIYASYNITKKLKTSFSITNIENKAPPTDINYAAGYNYYYYTDRGRYFRLGMNYKF